MFLGMEPSEAVEAAAREKAEKLDHFCPDIMACRVEIEQLQKHQHQGRPFGVRIQLSLPGHELNVGREQDEDVYVALRDAFGGMERQLKEVVQRRRRQEKAHPEPLHGKVLRLFDAESPQYGLIGTADGNEYYFDSDNLAGVQFTQLQLGAAVQFIADVASQGRQAKRVSLGKHQFG